MRFRIFLKAVILIKSIMIVMQYYQMEVCRAFGDTPIPVGVDQLFVTLQLSNWTMGSPVSFAIFISEYDSYIYGPNTGEEIDNSEACEKHPEAC